jgi:enamine deaminase RidA (YjgF/YER057c/UK114 family)
LKIFANSRKDCDVRAITPANFPWFRYEGYTFSLGLMHGDDAFLSGHSASEYDPESGRIVVKGGMTEQTKTAYAKIERILEAEGLTFADVTHVVENVTIKGILEYDSATAVREQLFAAHCPSLTTVVVDRLLRPAALIEIEVQASRGGGKSLISEADAGWSRSALHEGHDGAVFLPTMLPVDASGEIVHQGDFVAQYRYCLEKGGALLNRVGMNLGQAVTTYDFSTPATREVYPKSGRARKELLGGAGVFPGAGGILMSRLHHPEILIAIDITANRNPLRAINPGWKRYETLTYTPGVLAGETLYMSGFAALDMESQQALHPGDVVAQAEVTYDAILQVLEAAGASASDLVSTIEYVTPEGLDGYRGVAGVRQSKLRAPWPASTGALCAALLRPEFMLEVFPMAVLNAHS